MPKRFVTPLIACAVACFIMAGSGASARQADATRTLYVSVTDKNGAAVKDLEAKDFEVKEGGKLQKIDVRPAEAPLRVAVIVADWGTGNFQGGLSRFIEKLLGRAEFALYSVLPQAVRILNYASDPNSLIGGLDKLGPRGRQQGAQVMDAIQEALKDVKAEGKRPVVMVLRIGNDAATNVPGDTVKEQLRKTGAILNVLSLGVQSLTAPVSGSPTTNTAAQNALHNDEEQQGAFALQQVLGDGSKDSGGRYETIVSTTLIPKLDSMADELLHQYAITYTLPPGAKLSDKVSVSLVRKGLTLRAPSRVPN